MLRRCVQARAVGKEGSGVSFHLAGKRSARPEHESKAGSRSCLSSQRSPSSCSVLAFGLVRGGAEGEQP